MPKNIESGPNLEPESKDEPRREGKVELSTDKYKPKKLSQKEIEDIEVEFRDPISEGR